MPEAEKQAHKGRPRGPGRIARRDGYVLVRDPRDPEHWIYQHRLVAEQRLGRKLLHNEKIRHLNGDHSDNNPRNLLLVVETVTPLLRAVNG